MLKRNERMALLGVLPLVALGGCYPAPAKPPPDQDLAHAAQHVTDDLLHQLGPSAFATQTTSIDPMLDARTGQQTHACERTQAELTQSLLATARGLKLIPFGSAGAAEARWLVTGTLTVLPEPDRFHLSVAISDRQSGIVIAQAVTSFREAGMDLSPTKFYGDSPSLVRDRSVDGYVKTAATPRGQQADPLYIDQVPTSALLSDALTAYNAEKWDEALKLYEAAVQRKDGQQLRTFNGIYLANVRLGKVKEAEAAFAKIAALGLATNNLAVKLLFRPGGTDFWPDPKVSALYPMWLRQIAHVAQGADRCLDIVGHTSRSGSQQMNDRLSLARATAVRDILERDVPGVARKWHVAGVGYRENLVGSGTDDERDALDRRVEFKVVPCGT
ncbi:MAG TPA: OmpA family protein [Polyangia bacterium]|nr:OmpA family protein [Polyangia bacterium]